MAEAKRKSKAGAPRTEVFAMRLDPKLKYIAELAARKQRRSLANLIEWAIEEALRQTHLDYDEEGNSRSFWGRSMDLYDIGEPDRLVKLAFIAPDLLNFEEQHQWKLISENAWYWKGSIKKLDQNRRQFIPAVDPNSILLDRVRDTWDTIKQVAAGELTASEMPKPKLEWDEAELEDDLPF